MEKKFCYKAKSIDNKECVEGKGQSQIEGDGIEESLLIKGITGKGMVSITVIPNKQNTSDRMKKITKKHIERFAVGYGYPTDYVEKVLIDCNYNKEKAHEILCG